MDDELDRDAFEAREEDIGQQLREADEIAESWKLGSPPPDGGLRAALEHGRRVEVPFSDNEFAIPDNLSEDFTIYVLPDLNAQVLLGKIDNDLWQVSLRSDGNIPEVAVRDREAIVQAVIDAIWELVQ